jgi:Fe2+ or Zn2+ uptake regulation protein
VIRYTLAKGHDHYLICTGCSKKIKLDDCPLSPLELQLAKATGFEIERHSLTIYGKCPDCQKKRGTRAVVKKVERTQ